MPQLTYLLKLVPAEGQRRQPRLTALGMWPASPGQIDPVTQALSMAARIRWNSGASITAIE
jgi:hypothetical protein